MNGKLFFLKQWFSRKNKTEPKLEGSLHAFIIKMKLETFIVLIIIGYFLLAGIFSIIYHTYHLTNSPLYFDNLYFSLITQTTLGYGDILPKSITGRLLASVQAIIGMLYTSIFIAMLLYKLITISPKVIKFEDNAVFSPDDRTLRIRATNLFKIQLIDVNVKMYLRIWLEKEDRYATYDINLKRNQIPFMDPKARWFFATKPFNMNIIPENLEDLDIKSREIMFHPYYINKKYSQSNVADEPLLRLQLRAEIPLFGTTLIVDKTHNIDTILCGKFASISNKFGESNWGNWGKIDKSSSKECKNCKFYTNCGITTKHKNHKNKAIQKSYHPWIRFS